VAARRRKPSRSTLVRRWLGVVLLALIAAAYVQPLRAYRDARDDVEARRAEVAALEQEAARLETRLRVARSDEFVEREARRLALVHPGERLFIVSRAGE
jgi:cell division protein FtsB